MSTRTLAAATLAAAVLATVIATPPSRGTTPDDRTSDRVTAIRWAAEHLRPCPQEDSRNCYWDAGSRGNGLGRSFIDLNGTVFYLN